MNELPAFVRMRSELPEFFVSPPAPLITPDSVAVPLEFIDTAVVFVSTILFATSNMGFVPLPVSTIVGAVPPFVRNSRGLPAIVKLGTVPAPVPVKVRLFSWNDPAMLFVDVLTTPDARFGVKRSVVSLALTGVAFQPVAVLHALMPLEAV